MNLPMVDLKGQYENLKSEIEPALLQALSESRFILGPNVLAFEQEVADYLGVKHTLGCASGFVSELFGTGSQGQTRGHPR